MNREVQILLATHNGACHLAEQLDSLLAQTHKNWRLLVRDDCSTDATPQILAEYQFRYPEMITILPSGSRKLGASGNFSFLMASAEAEYFTFCDQDDVWMPDKIEKSLIVMETLEARHGSATPLLVHTDLKVTDSKLTPVAASLWKFQHSDPVGGVTLNRLLTQNAVTGCTLLINRPLRDLAMPIPAEAIMHDWWLALVAAAFGAISPLPEPTLFYRQHGDNDVGAKGFNVKDIVHRFTNWRKVNTVINRLYQQAAVFLARYHDRLTPGQRELLAAFATMGSASAFERRRRLLKYRFFYTGLLRNIGRFIIG